MDTYIFLSTSLIIILLSGIGVIYTIFIGMTEGRKKSVFAALGCTAGIIPHLFISIALSSLLMQMNDTKCLFFKNALESHLLCLLLNWLWNNNLILEMKNDYNSHLKKTIILIKFCNFATFLLWKDMDRKLEDITNTKN